MCTLYTLYTHLLFNFPWLNSLYTIPENKINISIFSITLEMFNGSMFYTYDYVHRTIYYTHCSWEEKLLYTHSVRYYTENFCEFFSFNGDKTQSSHDYILNYNTECNKKKFLNINAIYLCCVYIKYDAYTKYISNIVYHGWTSGFW